MISARKAKHLDATTMFTYSHANTPLGQSERAYYLSLSYFIMIFGINTASDISKLLRVISRAVRRVKFSGQRYMVFCFILLSQLTKLFLTVKTDNVTSGKRTVTHGSGANGLIHKCY